ncbi:MAG: YiiX family permuted papain-like enzyme [Bacteroidota bacterium]
MKKILFPIVLLGVVSLLVYWAINSYFLVDDVKVATTEKEQPVQHSKIQNGDIIFQTSTSNQSKAIQLATKSKYSHTGIIYENEDQYFVYEAVQPVQLTHLQAWINRGEDGHYVIKRLANADQVLTPATLAKMKKIGEKFSGKPYDIYFEWSDDKIYCSELVWKIYKEAANIEIGQLEKLSDFDLSHNIVKSKMKERYGDNIPLNEKVISPAAMFTSDQLILVTEK